MRVTVSGVAGVWWNGQNGVGGVRVYVCLEVEDAHTSTQYTSHTFHTSSYSFAKAHTRGPAHGKRQECPGRDEEGSRVRPRATAAPTVAHAMRETLALGVAVSSLVSVAILIFRHRRRTHVGTSLSPSGLIFTGTGCSSGLPLVGCTLDAPTDDCRACALALRAGRDDPNWRGNVSALIRFADRKSGKLRHVQIDCGKTFREITALRVYRQYAVLSLDALILTHDHFVRHQGLTSVGPRSPLNQQY